MEMKLSGTRIKELRLKLSWSQEKLAEEAGLNPRTVQRAESDGSASLRTRLQLAEALQVRPEELDAGLAAPTIQFIRPRSASVHYLAILLLVSVVYLAAQPAYFSISVTNFSWNNYWHGGSWYWIRAWWLTNFFAWALLSLPILYRLYSKHRSLFIPYFMAFGTGLGLSVFRLWEEAWVAEGLTLLVYLGGLALLVSLYVPRLNSSMLRHGVYMCLSTYVFLWFAHEAVFFIAMAYADIELPGGRLISRSQPLWRVAREVAVMLLRNVDDLVQLIPLGLVLALSFGERPRLQWPRLAPQALTEPPLTR